ncbi:hypothetical protein MTO96_001690 [Rhipicephalus appendiculatus]
MWKVLGIQATADSTTSKIEHPSDASRHLHFISDFPHLIKCLRNSLLKSGFNTPAGHVDMQHVREAYKIDSCNVTLKVMPGITRCHLDPNGFEKMRVSYAFQLFGTKVLQAFHLYKDKLEATLGRMDVTQEFFSKIHQLIRVMTSRFPAEALRPCSSGRAVLQDFLSYLKAWEQHAKGGGGFLSNSTAAGLRVKAHTQLKNIHNEQITKLQTKHQQDVELLEDLRNFTKIRATVEKEYGNALLKLATTYLQKKPPPGIEIKSEDSQEKKTVYGVWRMLLDETEKIAKARLAAAEVFSQQISENAKNVRANKLHVAKKCFDNLRRIQDEVQQCVQEVDKTKKLYFEEEHMAHEARDKAHDAEEKLKKKKGRIFQSITSLQKNSQKFSSRREACDIQSTKARNDYILALVAANAHQSRFYETDLPDILQSLDCDVSEKVKDYIQLMSRTELLTVAACNSSFSRILEDANHITRQYTAECFLQENQVLGKPIKYEFDPCDNDQVRTICTEHHADICLGKEAKKWASAYMKECRTLRDANKELNRLLGQIAKGEKTMESSTGEQEDVEQKLEDIRNSIRKAETSKLKAEARLEALREGGVNVDEFLNSLDIDSLQIDDLSRKGSTASRGSRKSSRSDLNYEEPNEAAYYEGDFESGSCPETSAAPAPMSVASEVDEAAQVMAASSAQGGALYEQDPTAVNWDDETEVSASAIDVGNLEAASELPATEEEVEESVRPAEEREGSLQVAIKCFALFSYEAANPDELSFVEQEEMEIVSEGDGDGWIKARNYKGEEGYIPQNYVEIAETQPAGGIRRVLLERRLPCRDQRRRGRRDLLSWRL